MRELDLGSAWLPTTRGSRSLISFTNWSNYGELDGVFDKCIPGIWVNADGVRYANELEGYSDESRAAPSRSGPDPNSATGSGPFALHEPGENIHQQTFAAELCYNAAAQPAWRGN